MASRKNPFLRPSLKSCRTLGILWLLSLPAHAIVVTTAVDEDNGNSLPANGTGISLREAAKYSSNGSTITFAPALSGALFRMTLAPLAVNRSLTIDASSLAQPIVLSGDKNASGGVPDTGDLVVMTIGGGGSVLIDSVVITGGYHTTTGAGIHITSGGLTLRNSTVTGNKGTAIYGGTGTVDIDDCTISNNTAGSGAAVNTAGILGIRDSLITGNHAFSNGGALLLDGDGPVLIEDCVISGNTAGFDGGAIRSDGPLTVRRCTFASNSADTSGGAIYDNAGTLTVETSTFSGNTADSDGGAIRSTSALTITHSTFSDNSAGSGGALFCDGLSSTISRSTFAGNSASGSGGAIIVSFGNVSLHRTTVSSNSAGVAGGISAINGDKITLSESIVAGNSGAIYPDLPSGFGGDIHITSGDPRLAPLGDYGGPTRTMPPLPGSPAIDAGTPTDLTADQRGFPPVGAPDIGAAEYQGRSDLARFWKLDPDGDGVPFGIEQATGTDNFVSNPGPLSGPVLPGEGGGLTLAFPLAPAPEPGTRWVLTRSMDLTEESFLPVYQFDGATDTAAPGITFTRTAGDITVTDATPPAGNAFYRLEAVLSPLPEP